MIFLIILPVAAIGLPVTGLVLTVDQIPMVSNTGKMSLKDVRHAQQLLQRYDPRSKTPDQITTITASQPELNSVLKASFLGVSYVTGRVVVNHFGLVAVISLSLPVPANPLGRYVNIRLAAAPSNSGLRISRFAVGSLELPPELVPPALEFLLNRFLGTGQGSAILISIRSLKVEGSLVTIGFRTPSARTGI